MALWLALSTAALLVSWDYQNSPGAAGAAPPVWPSGSALAPPADRPRLVVLAHPRCPCTRASLAELARIMAENRGALSADVLFFAPRATDASWHRTDLFNRAAEIPDVHARRDDDGREAARFGALTSGQTVLYAASGELLFAGGITPGRGHQGDNAGRSAIAALLRDRPAAARSAAVFGCSLREPEAGS